ncbi:MAG: carboxypeptidase regulatory-like domain-containing protein [Myxococcales bacterium]|nr:carboxypeptidase regulatory-like domain-containing protein [Myxococcales bacterium]
MQRAASGTASLAVCAAALASLAGCTCGPSQTMQAPTSPLGSIAGRLTSLRTGAALSGVKVTVVQVEEKGATELSATTGADGTFALRNLPAGTVYRARFSLDGHVPRFMDVLIPDAAGEYPQGNGVAEVNMALAPSTASITGKIIAGGAQPARGAKVGVDMRPANFDLVAEVVAGNDGSYSVTGLPGSPTGVPVTIVVQPFDENADGQADYGVVQVGALAFPDIATRAEIDLRTAASALVLLASDMDDGQHKADQPMNLVFNRPLDPTRLDVTFTDVDNGRTIATGQTLGGGATTVAVKPSGGNLAVGTNYRLTVTARATNGAAGVFTRLFQAVGGTTTNLPQVTGLTVKPTDVDWNAITFNLAWNAVPGAYAYRVYAKDTRSNPAYVQLGIVGARPTPSTSITLPASFDIYPGDGYRTPFAYGARVDFAVMAENVLGDVGDPATFNAVRLSDNVAPRVVSAMQNGNADNSTGAQPVTLQVTVSFSEYMDNAALPTMSTPPGVSATFELDPNLLSGVFSVTVPAGTNGTGAYRITGGKDTTGNPLVDYDGALRSVVELISNGGFEDCALTGWTPGSSGSASLPSAATGISSSGNCSARLGNATVGGPSPVNQWGTSSIYQQISLPAGATNITASAKFRGYTNYPYQYHDTVSCGIYTVGGSLLSSIFNDYLNDAAFRPATANITAYAGSTVRLICQSYQDGAHQSGMYLDEVSVLVTP